MAFVPTKRPAIPKQGPISNELSAEAEALFREARQRERRRRLIGLAAVLTACVVGFVVYAVGFSGQAKTALSSTPSPAVNRAAFSKLGDLAFVSKGQLWVLDGATDALAAVTQPGLAQQASSPAYSPDGRWLIYGVSASYGVGARQAWLARADGSSPRLVATGFDAVGWLADGRLIAGDRLWRVASSGALTRVGSAPSGLAAVSSDGRLFVFFSRTLHVSPPRSSTGFDRLEVATSLNGKRTAWFQARVSFTPQSGLQGPFFVGAIALPGHAGILLRAAPFCCDYADGVTLYEIKAPGAQAKNLGATVGDTVASGPHGTFAFTQGGDRYAWVTKSVETCSAATQRCTRLRTPANTLSLNPAYSPDGHTLAFVEAASVTDSTIGQPDVRRWYATHSLWILRQRATTPTEIRGTRGAAAPVWSADGKSVLYVANDALWLLPTLSSRPVRIASPLFTPNDWQSFYGEISWSTQFAWLSHP